MVVYGILEADTFACGQILVARRMELLTNLKIDLEYCYGAKVLVVELDLTDDAACELFYNALAEEERDNIDIIVNNAGFSSGFMSIVDTDWDLMTRMIDTNVKAAVKMIRLFVPGMIKRGSGHIINVGSVAGKDSVGMAGIYCGTKHMLEAINTSLRAELVATPIRVSLVSPGFTESEFWLVASSGNQEAAAAVAAGFKSLEAIDIADNIAYIASRPPHVQVVDIITMPSSQASIDNIHRTFSS